MLSSVPQVKVIDGGRLVSELAGEEEPTAATAGKGGGRGGVAKPQELKPLATHTHSSEGWAVDWSRVKAGRLATGDCRHKIYVWEPTEGGKWQVGRGAVGKRDAGSGGGG